MTQSITQINSMGMGGRVRTFLPKDEFTGLEYVGSITMTFTPNAVFDPAFEYVGTLTYGYKAPDTGVIEAATLPGAILASITIDGVDFTNSLRDEVTLTLEDSAATTFDLTINTSSPPSSFLGKQVKIGIQAADMSGVIADYIPVFIGQVRSFNFLEDEKTTLTLACTDFGGVHGRRGELVSTEVTPVKTGNISIDSGAGTYNTGFAPLIEVVFIGTDPDAEDETIVDGRDFFTNTLSGTISVPETSNFNITPGSLQFTYSGVFGSLKEIIQSIATLKGWTLEEDGVVIPDYSDPSKQPVISLSDESIIDIIRKLLELGGQKIRTNLFPSLSVYSEAVNLGGVDVHIIDEDTYEKTLRFTGGLDNVLTEQQVKTVGKTFANIEISDFAVTSEESGTEAIRTLYTLGIGLGNPDPYAEFFGSEIITEVRIAKANVSETQLTVGGTFDYYGTVRNIIDSDWVKSIEGDEIVFKLVFPNILYAYFFASTKVGYPGATWTLTIETKSITYGEGTIEDIVEVTSQRSITGISDTLAGDPYEGAWLETAQHCTDCANAILTTRGNVNDMSASVPIHAAASMKIGQKINVLRDSIAIYKGNITLLEYKINLNTAFSPVRIESRGVLIGV